MPAAPEACGAPATGRCRRRAGQTASGASLRPAAERGVRGRRCHCGRIRFLTNRNRATADVDRLPRDPHPGVALRPRYRRGAEPGRARRRARLDVRGRVVQARPVGVHRHEQELRARDDREPGRGLQCWFAADPGRGSTRRASNSSTGIDVGAGSFARSSLRISAPSHGSSLCETFPGTGGVSSWQSDESRRLARCCVAPEH